MDRGQLPAGDRVAGACAANIGCCPRAQDNDAQRRARCEWPFVQTQVVREPLARLVWRAVSSLCGVGHGGGLEEGFGWSWRVVLIHRDYISV